MGKRVSIRLAIHTGDSKQRFTDVVGVLTSWTDGVVCITRRTGEEFQLPESALVAGKVVPDAPAQRRGPTVSAEELDRIASRGWPSVETEWLGDWELRAAGGFTRRANSALALGDPGVPLDDALYAVTEWYAERDLPAYVQLATGGDASQELLGKELQTRGWNRVVSAETRVNDLAPLVEADVDTEAVDLSRRIDELWLSRYQRFGRPAPEVLQVLSGGPSVWFATVHAEPPDDDAESGTPVAIGRCVVDGRWAGFAAIEVDPQRRREGLATAVMAALARRAAEEGATAGYLQVEVGNESARSLYDRMGFTTHHLYHHWRAPRDELS